MHAYMHAHMHAHTDTKTACVLNQDIKPENILIHNKIYKIADFGLSKIVQDQNVKLNISSRYTAN